jgi:hypothetical protein
MEKLRPEAYNDEFRYPVTVHPLKVVVYENVEKALIH